MGGGWEKKNKNTNKKEAYGNTGSPFNRPSSLNVTFRSDVRKVFVCFQLSDAIHTSERLNTERFAQAG